MRELVHRVTSEGTAAWYEGAEDTGISIDDTENVMTVVLRDDAPVLVTLGRGDAQRTLTLEDITSLALRRQAVQRVYAVTLPEWMVTLIVGASVAGAVFSFITFVWMGAWL